MNKWCYNCKQFADEGNFYPDAPEKALCRSCIKFTVKKRNSPLILQAERREREQEALRDIIRQIQANKDPFVYLIEHENKYKIGFSRDINKRMKSFNTSHAIPCKIIGIAPGDLPLEGALHNKFKDYRLNGEWFLKKLAILEEFKKLIDATIFLPGYLKQEGSTPSCEMDVS